PAAVPQEGGDRKPQPGGRPELGEEEQRGAVARALGADRGRFQHDAPQRKKPSALSGRPRASSGPRRARSRLRLDSASQKPTCLALNNEKRRTGHYFFFLAAFFFAGAFFLALLDPFLFAAISASSVASTQEADACA